MKLLAIDIGNSTAVFGILKCGELKKKWSVETAKLSIKLPEWNEAVIISSVVPSKDKLIRKKYPQAKFVG